MADVIDVVAFVRIKPEDVEQALPHARYLMENSRKE